MEEQLLDETSFDVIVVGTGIAESMLSSALACQGKTVLHLDYNGFYGSNCTTLSLPALEELGGPTPASAEEPSEGDNCRDGFPGTPNITNFTFETFQPPKEAAMEGPPAKAAEESAKESTGSNDEEAEPENESTKEEGQTAVKSEGVERSDVESAADEKAEEVAAPAEDIHERLLKQGRSFNIDLYCTGILSNGRLVELLVNSHVHHYLEFKSFDNSYICTADGLKEVPCSKKAVFKSSYVSLNEKRQLTRFVKTYVQADPGQPPADLDEEQSCAPFAEFLKAKKLSDKLRDIILYAIVLADTDQAGELGVVSTKDGLERMRRYMASLGRYGESPMIYSLFGMSELPQAFSRNSAVKGTIFVLRRGVKKFLIDTETKAIKGVVCSAGQELTAGTVICTKNYWVGKRDLLLSHSRAVVVTDRPLVEGKERIIVSLPPSESSPPVLAYQLDSSVSTSPKGTYLVQLVSKAIGQDARADLVQAVANLFSTEESTDDSKPPALYTAYFNMQRYSDSAVDEHTLPANLYLCGDTPAKGIELEWRAAVEEAERIYHLLCGEDAEFFGETPDPLEEPVEDHVEELIKYAQAIEEHKTAVLGSSTSTGDLVEDASADGSASADAEEATNEPPAAVEDEAASEPAAAVEEKAEEAADVCEAPSPAEPAGSNHTD